MGDTTNRVAGTASLQVDGAAFPLRGNFTYKPGIVDRSTVTGQDGVHGYKEMPNAPYIECDITDAGNLSVAAINAMTNVTVTAQLANGKTVVGRSMWSVQEQAVKTVDALFTVRWEGPQVTETQSQVGA